MRKSIATVSVSGTLDEKLAAVSAAKFDGIELFDQDLVNAPASPREVALRCADLGLAIELFQPVRDLEGVAPEHFPATLRRLARKLDVMEQLGVTTLLACSNALPTAIDDPDLSAEQLSRLGDLVHERGATLAFEALAWGTHVNRLHQAWDIVERADHPAVGLAVDTFHLLSRGDDATALRGIPGERIAFLQIADAPLLRTDVLEWSRHHRCFPGQGTLDVASVVAATIDAGYRGPLSLEVFSDIVREADPRSTALDAMRSLLHLEEELRLHWAGATVTERPRVTLFDPPPAPADVQMGFVEIAVTPDAGSSGMTGLLTALGFTRAGEHRSKPVTWWRNGGAHVLLNASSDLDDRWASATDRPCVTGIGLEVDDVAALAQRGSALLWPSLRLRHGAGEAHLLGVDAPAGVHVFVAGAGDSDEHWQRDFVPDAAHPSDTDTNTHTGTGETGADQQTEPTASDRSNAPGGWLGIDHVGYAVPFDLSDAELSFYRTLFGLAPGVVSEFMNPHGRLRSRVIRRTDGVRPSVDPQVVLNVAEGRPTLRRAGINQIAFGCTDVFAAAEAMRATGIGLLAVPDNYYVDLQARFDLAPDLLTRLRSHGVLYDRDDRGGELFHVYTRAVADRFYVEVLQRTGDYSGFGSPNTPVRLAAQTAQKADARPRPDLTPAATSPPFAV